LLSEEAWEWAWEAALEAALARLAAVLHLLLVLALLLEDPAEDLTLAAPEEAVTGPMVMKRKAMMMMMTMMMMALCFKDQLEDFQNPSHQRQPWFSLLSDLFVLELQLDCYSLAFDASEHCPTKISTADLQNLVMSPWTTPPPSFKQHNFGDHEISTNDFYVAPIINRRKFSYIHT